MKDWKDNWQLRVIAFLLALALWFYLYSKDIYETAKR